MENEVINEQNETDQVPTTVQDDVSTRLANAMWGEPEVSTPDTPTVETPVVETPTVETPVVETPAEEILDESSFIKKYFEGFDNVDAVKNEIESLRSKSQIPAEIKFENEFSDKIFKALQAGKTKEVTKLLAEQDRIDEIMATEVTEDTAEDFIKMGMQLKYKEQNLTQKEIEYKFNKEFGLPKKPEQRTDEIDEDFNERLSQWEEKVSDIKMNRVIEAKLLKPEIEKSKSKIVFPELPQNTNAETKPSQEDLDAYKKHHDSFIQAAQTTVNSLNGFSVQVKDKDVDYTVNYAPSQEEKTFINEKLKEFADKGFNSNAILADRWVNEDGTMNVNVMTADLLKIYASDKASQKLVSDAVNKRMEIYLKDKKNIRIDGANNGTFVPDAKSTSEKLQESFWGN